MSRNIIEARVIGGPEVSRRFATSGDKLRVRMQETLANIGETLKAQAQGRAPIRKGKLRRSFRSRVFTSPQTITVRVAAKKYYARFVEQGIGPVTSYVKSHNRRQRSGDVRGGASGRKVVALGFVHVRSYPRKMFSAAKPFLGPALAGMRETIMAQLLGVTQGTLQDGS